MNKIREAAVAGMFYPADTRQLSRMISELLSNADLNELRPKALIAPHAGYVYSGPVAASAYAYLQEYAATIERVVLLGPAHRMSIRGLAASSADAFATPLGVVPLDREAIESILVMSQVQIIDEAYSGEHGLEVHLPFLQTIIPRFSLVPLLVGTAKDFEVAEVLEKLWGGPETIIIISSDLSHFHDYATAHALDHTTAVAIENFDLDALRYDCACGRTPIRGLLQVARRHGLSVHTVDLRNSGDTAGSKERVVGYGAFVFSKP
ncbi:MAG: AmmeMemoRadiSam system protein B [Candidatus Promineifilaceae bacterium]|nr:AmmeMemoRadiSam system protein B [Candidatus Promineifilaceae bacterium]